MKYIKPIDMDIDISDVRTLTNEDRRFSNPADYTDMLIDGAEYCCDNGHSNPQPFKYVYSTSYNPNTNEVVEKSNIVFACGTCRQPIMLDEDFPLPEDELYPQALVFVKTSENINYKTLQEHLDVGFNRANHLIEKLVKEKAIKLKNAFGDYIYIKSE